MSDWIDVLRAEVERTSQSAVAKRMGYASSVVSQVLTGSYAGTPGQRRAARARRDRRGRRAVPGPGRDPRDQVRRTQKPALRGHQSEPGGDVASLPYVPAQSSTTKTDVKDLFTPEARQQRMREFAEEAATPIAGLFMLAGDPDDEKVLGDAMQLIVRLRDERDATEPTSAKLPT